MFIYCWVVLCPKFENEIFSENFSDKTGFRKYRHLVADALGQKPVPDLPREDAGILLLEVADEADHLGRRDARRAAADGARKDGPGLVVPGQDLGDAAVADPQLPRDVARPDAQLESMLSNSFGQNLLIKI
jgi:hypothetical protein